MSGKSPNMPKEQSFDNITNKNSLMRKDTKSVYNLLSPNTTTLKGNIQNTLGQEEGLKLFAWYTWILFQVYL